MPPFQREQVAPGRLGSVAQHGGQVAAAEPVDEVVDRGESGVEHHICRRAEVGRTRAGAEQPGDGRERGVGDVVQFAVEVCRLRVDGDGTQQLARIVGAQVVLSSKTTTGPAARRREVAH
jgi:hypothetical protein